jgi:hypothetical protein
VIWIIPSEDVEAADAKVFVVPVTADQIGGIQEVLNDAAPPGNVLCHLDRVCYRLNTELVGRYINHDNHRCLDSLAQTISVGDDHEDLLDFLANEGVMAHAGELDLTNLGDGEVIFRVLRVNDEHMDLVGTTDDESIPGGDWAGNTVYTGDFNPFEDQV